MVLAVLALFMMAPGADNLNLDPAQLAALPHRYSIAKWEAANLLSKWVHMVVQLSWIRDRGSEEDAAAVVEYFRLAEETSRAKARLSALAAEGSPGLPRSWRRSWGSLPVGWGDCGTTRRRCWRRRSAARCWRWASGRGGR